MPTATVTGALLGWAVEKRVNQFRKFPSGPGSYALMMAIGAVVANTVVVLDNCAQRRKLERFDWRRRYGGGGGGDNDLSPSGGKSV